MEEKLRYPIGQFVHPGEFTGEVLKSYIHTIATFPVKIKTETQQLSEDKLDTPYREGGWTIRQVVNHCSDSHMNALIRVKLTLSEETPTIKPYDEAAWARFADSISMPIEPALAIINGVHDRWVVLLGSLTTQQWQRSFIHPEKGRSIPLNESTGMYAWHCDHHLAHITVLKKKMGWA